MPCSDDLAEQRLQTGCIYGGFSGYCQYLQVNAANNLRLQVAGVFPLTPLLRSLQENLQFSWLLLVSNWP